MLLAFIGAVAFTIGASFYCSLMESLILSTTVAEIEGLKKSKPRKGAKLEHLKIDLPNTISAITDTANSKIPNSKNLFKYFVSVETQLSIIFFLFFNRPNYKLRAAI